MRRKKVIMSVNGVTSSVDKYDTYSRTAVEAKNAEKTDVSGEKSTNKQSAGVTYSSKMSDEERAALVEKLKADNQVQIDSFKSMVQDMLKNQGIAVKNSDDIWSMLANGNFSVDQAAADKAKSLIASDGYWGVEQTSGRIFEMAKALSGGDEEGMNDMLAAFEKGYKQATKTWGKELPDISSQTYEAVHQKFKDYQESLKTQTAAVEG